jgi:serine/threonine-protein kinase
MHLESAPPSPQELRPDISPDLSEIILRCLAKDRSQRYATASELHSALIAMLD